MTGDSLPTRFAPAERAPAAELAEQAFYFAQREDMQQFLDAIDQLELATHVTSYAPLLTSGHYTGICQQSKEVIFDKSTRLVYHQSNSARR